jgi:uncharacterized protein (TIGR02231 family)
MSTRLGVLCMFTMLVPSGWVLAADIPTAAPIRAVTVFPDRAEVTRLLEVSLPAGASTLVIDDLPASLFAESVRVSGEGGASVAIGSVETKPIYAEAAVSEMERRLQAEVQDLSDQRRAAEDRIAALRVQLNFIATIGREMPTTANDEIVRGTMDPAKWQQAWTALSGGAAEAQDGIRAAEIAIRDVDAKLAQKNQELAQIHTGRNATVVARINLEATTPATVKLRLSYQLPDAGWRPLYDARLDSEAGHVELAQLGEVQQRTGEDWSGVALTLSTARPAVGAALPELGSWFLNMVRLDDLAKQYGAVSADEAPAAEPDSDSRREKNNLADKPAQLVASEFAAEYRISGTATVPSDDAPHKFVIADHDLPATLAVRTVPKLMPAAHLYATVAYDGKEPLLPGQLSVFRDGAFIGTGSLAMLRPKEKVELGFGVDDKLSVDYQFETGEQSTEGLFTNKQRLERRYRIAIANHHSRPIEVTVLDQLPVPQDERIEVELLTESTKPTKQDWEDRKGVVAWTASYAPNEERVIKFGYGVTYPEGTHVAGL